MNINFGFKILKLIFNHLIIKKNKTESTTSLSKKSDIESKINKQEMERRARLANDSNTKLSKSKLLNERYFTLFRLIQLVYFKIVKYQ